MFKMNIRDYSTLHLEINSSKGWFGFMVFNATFNHISVISWQSSKWTELTLVFYFSQSSTMRMTHTLR